MAITKDLGIVTAYGYALAGGFVGTEEEFAELMNDVATTAGDAEAWARGTRGGTPVEEGAEQYENNAKYYAEQAGSEKEAAAASATAAAGSATTAGQRATAAGQSATNAAASATAAAGSATAAQGSAGTAEQQATIARNAASAAEQAKEQTEALLSTKGDALSYDAAAAELSLKSGETTLSTVGVGLKWVKDSDGTGATSLQATVENDVSGNTATGQYSHAEGLMNNATGTASHAENGQNTASGMASHAEGTQNTASGSFSHAEGTKNTASGIASHAEGRSNIASNQCAHAEGNKTEASGGASHTEGQLTYASGVSAHAEGENSFARARANHVEGIGNEADTSQIALHMGGVYGVTSTATGKTISVQDKKSDGTYDGTPVSRVLGEYAEIIGNGNSDADRSNARTLDWNGNEVISGKLTMGAGPTGDMDATTKGYTDALRATIPMNVQFGERVNVVPETTLSFSQDGANAWYASAVNPISGFTSADFLLDALYKVTWDGVEYDAFFVEHTKPMARASQGAYYWGAIGNSDALGNASGYDTDAPFCIAYNYENSSNEVRIFAFNDTAATHTLKIDKVPFTAAEVPAEYMEPGTRTPLVRHGSAGNASVVVGGAMDATGHGAYAEGIGTKAIGMADHAEGLNSVASGINSHAEGGVTVASGKAAHAEGQQTVASGRGSHAEGGTTTASGNYAHAENSYNEASGGSSHAEGQDCFSSGPISHAEGEENFARARTCHLEGVGHELDATQLYTHVSGAYSVSPTATGKTISVQPKNSDGSSAGNPASRTLGLYAEIVGIGDSDAARANGRTLDWSGNEWIAGNFTAAGGSITVGSTTITEAQLIALLALLN